MIIIVIVVDIKITPFKTVHVNVVELRHKCFIFLVVI